LVNWWRSFGVAEAQDDRKALLERTCTECHALTSTLKQRSTRAGWSAVVDDMVARGAAVSDAETHTIIDYLAKNFGPKVNVNEAFAEDLARVSRTVRRRDCRLSDEIRELQGSRRPEESA
jgi:competence protein ComEA